MRYIVVVCMVLTGVSGDNRLLGRIQGGRLRIRYVWDLISSLNFLKSTPSRVGLDEVEFDFDIDGTKIISEKVKTWFWDVGVKSGIVMSDVQYNLEMSQISYVIFRFSYVIFWL
jgi:hypothetical protein